MLYVVTHAKAEVAKLIALMSVGIEGDGIHRRNYCAPACILGCKYVDQQFISGWEFNVDNSTALARNQNWL
jgi:hypothetical protein